MLVRVLHSDRLQDSAVCSDCGSELDEHCWIRLCCRTLADGGLARMEETLREGIQQLPVGIQPAGHGPYSRMLRIPKNDGGLHPAPNNN